MTERRNVRALLLAPLAPSLLWVVLDGASRAITFGPMYFLGALLFGVYLIIVMEIFALFLGWPLIVALRDHLDSLVICMVGGAVVATAPFLLMAFLAPLPDFASSDGTATVINGHRTVKWYVETAEAAAICGLFGVLGGAAFWRLRRPGEKALPK